MTYPLGLTDLRLVFVYLSLFNLFQVLRLKGRKESDECEGNRSDHTKDGGGSQYQERVLWFFVLMGKD